MGSRQETNGVMHFLVATVRRLSPEIAWAQAEFGMFRVWPELVARMSSLKCAAPSPDVRSLNHEITFR